MKKIFIIIVGILCVWMMYGNNTYADERLLKLDGTEKEKVICVVYDNSSSMCWDIKLSDKYTDRWVQADYAMKALALMMNAGDTLQPYIMGDYKDYNPESGEGAEVPSIRIQEDREATLGELEKIMDAMEFTEWTYFSSVEAAADNLKEYNTKDIDCWIIILTDGSFEIPGKKKTDEELKKNLEDITNKNANISIAYVPIGENTAKLNEDRNKRIYTAKGSSIMEQVTYIINLIYGRVQVDESIKNDEDYFERDNGSGRIKINIDIPIERMLVFLQDAGETGNYVDLEDGLADKLDEKITDTPPTTTDIFLENSDISFSGRANIPDMGNDVAKHEKNLIQYSILRGLIYDFAGDSEQIMNMDNQYVSIEVNQEAYDEIDVYYQPAVLVAMDYYQNGEKIEHGETCTAALSSGETEKCIREGEMTIQLYMTDSRGEKIENQASKLLYEENFEVELKAHDGSSVPVQPLGDYRYQFAVKEGNYTLNVRTAWNELYAKEIEVQEPVRPLELECISTNKIWIDQKEGEGSTFSVQITEGGEIVTQSVAREIEIACMVQDENFEVEPLGYQEHSCNSEIMPIE